MRTGIWGAARLETYAAMAGYDLAGAARYRTTHAVDIAASAAQVWPWLLQLGQGRGGMYSYEWLADLFGLHVHSTARIDPALQDLAVGPAPPIRGQQGLHR